MIDRTKQHRLLLTSSALAAGTQLLVTHSALAHAGHAHMEEATQVEPSTPENQRELSSESAATEEIASPSDKVNSDPTMMPPLEMHMNSTDRAPVQETQATQEATSSSLASVARLSDGFFIGLGETLLGIIIAGPFLLMFLKKQLHARRRFRKPSL